MGRKENILRGLDFAALTATFLGQALIFYVIFTQGVDARDGTKVAWIITDLVVLYILYASWLAVGKGQRIKACWERMGRQQEEMRLAVRRRKERDAQARQEAQDAVAAATVAATAAAAAKQNGNGAKSSIEEEETEDDSTTTATGATGSTEQPVPEEPTDGAAAAGDTNEPLVPVERGPQRPYTFPITSLAWGIYALSLCVKIWILFRNNVPQNLSKDAGFGPHVFRFGIGLATFVFSLLVLGQKVIRGTFEDDTRNDYLHNLCFRVALEILDSASFVTLIMPLESHLMVPYGLENSVLLLASINLFLPCVSLYKLRDPEFGKKYAHKLEIGYKILHLLLVDTTFLIIRLYLWSAFNTDTSVFIIKNVYALASFLRGLLEDARTIWRAIRKSPVCYLCREYYCVCCLCEETRYNPRRPIGSGGDGAVELITRSVAGSTASVNRTLVSTSSLQGPSDFNLRIVNTGRQTSMSTKGMHGSASSFDNIQDRPVPLDDIEKAA